MLAQGAPLNIVAMILITRGSSSLRELDPLRLAGCEVLLEQAALGGVAER